MEAREIPGHYWDADKKRYFRITGHHTAPSNSAAAKYSVDNVKKRKANAREAAAIEVKAKAPTRKYALANRDRSYNTAARTMRDLLAREHGTLGSAGEEALPSAALVDSWEPKHIMSSRCNRRGVDTSIREAMSCISAFAWHEPTDRLFLPVVRGAEAEDLGMVHGIQSRSLDPTSRFDTCLGHYVDRGLATISSIHINHARDFLVTTWRGSATQSNVTIQHLGTHVNTRLTVNGTSAQDRMEILTSTPTPDGSKYGFILGTSTGIIAVDPDTANCFRDNFNQDPKSRPQLNIQAVECLPALSPFVLAVGQENGKIRVHDDRTRTARMSFQHSSRVTSIRQIDTNRILVAGTRSTLGQYDLRYLKDTQIRKEWPQLYPDASMNQRDHMSCTTTVLKYPEHINEAFYDLGFDVDVETGLVAAAQSDPFYRFEMYTVKIFSLHSGEMLKNIEIPGTKQVKRFLNPIKALKFVDDGKVMGDKLGFGPQLKSLWIAKDENIFRYA